MLFSTPKQAQKVHGKAAGPYSLLVVFETGYRQAAVFTPRDGIRYAYELDENDRPARFQRGAVSLPLLAFQACAAIGLASGVVSALRWMQGVLGGVL